MRRTVLLLTGVILFFSLSACYKISDSSCTCSGEPCCCSTEYLEGDECIPCVCYNGGSTCEQDTRKCLCETDTGGKWSGDQCTDCVDEAWCQSKCKHCYNGDGEGSCTPSLAGFPGIVLCNCVPPWTGPYCDECEDSLWGSACDKQCTCQNGAKCDQNTGECSYCNDGYWGGNCDQLCDCQNGAPAACHQATGICDCVNAWTGDKCTECLEGWTGQNCDSCDTGYAGDQCQPCECKPPTCYYGDNCESLTECTCYNGAVTCNHVTGVCECQPPWSGDDCTVCDSSLELGGVCDQLCSHCYNAVECILDGNTECECTPGYYGDKCELMYEKGDNIFQCYNGAPGLYDEFGDCICAAGWTGQFLASEGGISMCTTCDLIEENNYCSDTCLNCYNAEACDPASSDCYCTPGWKGSFCDEPCDEGRYGDLCMSTCSCEPYEVCDHVYGCVCPTGFSGSDCTSPCDDTHCGVNCQFECRCQSSEVCDSQDGSCHCPLGKYGVDCSQACNCPYGAECEPLDGSCHCKDSEGCGGTTTITPSDLTAMLPSVETTDDRMAGDTAESTGTGGMTAIAVGSAAAGGALLIIIGLFVVCMLRKKGRGKKTEEESQTTSSQWNAYEVEDSANISYSTVNSGFDIEDADVNGSSIAINVSVEAKVVNVKRNPSKHSNSTKEKMKNFEITETEEGGESSEAPNYAVVNKNDKKKTDSMVPPTYGVVQKKRGKSFQCNVTGLSENHSGQGGDELQLYDTPRPQRVKKVETNGTQSKLYDIPRPQRATAEREETNGSHSNEGREKTSDMDDNYATVNGPNALSTPDTYDTIDRSGRSYPLLFIESDYDTLDNGITNMNDDQDNYNTLNFDGNLVDNLNGMSNLYDHLQ